VKDEGMEFEF